MSDVRCQMSDVSGQAMILAVLALGGTVLSATVIAGFLLVYQIRQATDLTNSTKAIYAADTGLECALYNHFSPSSLGAPCPGSQTLANGATFTTECFDDLFNPQACAGAASTQSLSHGLITDTRRNFLVLFGSANAIFP